MTFLELCLSITGILSIASLISLIVTGYIITFSVKQSIQLIWNTIKITSSKKALATNYQKMMAKSIRHDLLLIYNATDKEIQDMFKNTTLKEFKSEAIKSAAEKAMTDSDDKLYSIDKAKVEIETLHISGLYQAYHYLSDEIVKQIMNSYHPSKQLSKHEITKSAGIINQSIALNTNKQ